MEEIGAVGHRIVASGEYFKKTTLVTPEVLKTLEEKTFELAPLHNPAAATGLRACMEVMPDTPMALVFDSSFHATMPEKAYLFGIDYEDYKKYGVRKYGAHGTSHKFVSSEAAKYLGKNPEQLKIVTCHLGNGSSISAVDGGKCVDTSMGFTPLAGVLMGTRSGDIDASAVEFLARKKGMSHADTVTYLNKKCGVAGISGVSSDHPEEFKPFAHVRTDRRRIFAYACRKHNTVKSAHCRRVRTDEFFRLIREHVQSEFTSFVALFLSRNQIPEIAGNAGNARAKGLNSSG